MEIEQILQQPEGKKLEFKERVTSTEGIAKTVVAFSNLAGGEIYIGVEDGSRKITGIPEDEVFRMEEKLANSIYDLVHPKVTPDISIVNVKGKYLIRIAVYPGSNPPYYLGSAGKSKGTFVRIGSVNRPASEEILLELERKKRNIPFDSTPLFDIEPSAIDLTSFLKEYQAKTGESPDGTTLQKLGLLKEERGELVPTVASVLLSGGELKREHFPYAVIECAAFKGNDLSTTLDSRTIDSELVHQPGEALAFVQRNIRMASKLEGLYRSEKWEYPLAAVRELIINAIVHRDYSLSGRYIKLAIYNDMIEITSPGYLPGTLDPQHLGTGISELRNKVLGPVFRKLKLIEQWGTGFKKVKEELKNYPELELRTSEPNMSFQVQLVKKALYDFGPTSIDQSDLVREVNPWRMKTPKEFVKDPVLIEILKLCLNPVSLAELMEKTGKKDKTKFREKYIKPYLNKYLFQTEPEKPKSPNQKYYLSGPGKDLLEDILTSSRT